jgi:hypothetical protein
MRDSLQKAARTFKLPYSISAVTFQNHEDMSQYLAVGLVDGAIIVLDLILGVEKFFLEKHPAEITTMAFFEDKTLLSGSVDGRVVLQELESPSNQEGQGSAQGGDRSSSDKKSQVLRCPNC